MADRVSHFSTQGDSILEVQTYLRRRGFFNICGAMPAIILNTEKEKKIQFSQSFIFYFKNVY